MSKKITQLMANKIKYCTGTDMFDKDGNFLVHGIKFACTNYTVLLAYIMGATKTGNVNGYAGDNAWYYYNDFYNYTEEFENNASFSFDDNMNIIPWVNGEIGTTVLANNTTVLKKDININKVKIVKWMNNPTKYKKQLSSLIGTVFMQKVLANSAKYDKYDHTGIIVGYKVVGGKAVLILNDSTSTGNRFEGPANSMDGVGITYYSSNRISRQGLFDILKIL